MSATLSRSVLIGASRGSAAGSPARLQLTSLVDMMVILVVFLLKSFAVEGQLVEPAANVDLPLSTVRAAAPVGVVVAVGTRLVQVAGQDVATTASLADTASTGSTALLAALRAASGAADAPVLIQADRAVAYHHLSRVLRACAVAGWQDVSLVVLEVES
jgi:biopolymer transport protein ExbD